MIPRSLATTAVSAILLACGSSAPPPAQTASPTASSSDMPDDHHDHDHDHAHDHGHAHHDHDGMTHRFEHADDWTKVFDAPDRDAWQKPDDVIAALELTPSMTVADIGAGTGYFSVRIARKIPNGQVIAQDIEADMVRFLGERAKREQLANLRAQQGSPSDPGLAPASVDRILVVDVWHHVDDRPAYAAKLARALKPGGFVAIVDFTMEATHGPSQKHRLTPESVMAELRGAGLEPSISPTKLPDQYIAIGRAR